MDHASSSQTTSASRARCYRRARTRWGIDLAVLMGTGLMIYTVAVGYGYRLATSRLADSTAALAALAPPEIPAERNAALVLEQAERDKVWVRWEKVKTEAERNAEAGADDAISKDPTMFHYEQFRKPETYAEGSSLRRLLAANTKALEIAHRAAALPECRWTCDWSQGFLMGKWPPFGISRALINGLRLHAMLSAHDGHWQDARRDISAIFILAQKYRSGPGLICSLVSDSFESLGRDSLQKVLWITPVDTRVYEDAQALIGDTRSRPDSLARFFFFENASLKMLLDQVGSGSKKAWQAFSEPSAFSDDCPHGPIIELIRLCEFQEIPEPLASYSIMYPWERACMDDVFLADPIDHWEQLLKEHPLHPYLATYQKPTAGESAAPARDRVIRLSRECYAGWDLARVGLRLSKWGHDHGHLPTDLNEAGLTADEQRDPYDSTRSLHWQRADDGRQGVLWNFGTNNRDDTDGRIDDAHGDDRTWIVVLPEAKP